MSYRRIPYAVRYLIALASWATLFAMAVALKFMFVFVMPLIWMHSAFGAAKTQQSVQMNVNLVDFYVYVWPPFPRPDWRRLLTWRGSRSANQTPHARLVEDID